MITVLIPTAARARMLRTALQSIADQTALDRVERVFIADNGTTQEGQAVAAEFPQLKITYRMVPGLDALEQKKVLLQEGAQSKYAAILHDDDWWTPRHLDYAWEALEKHPNASAYGTSNFVVKGEASMLNCNGNLFPWFSASYAPFKPYWEVSRLNVLLGSILGTFCHYSTLVAPAGALQKCLAVYEQENFFAHDRMLMFTLSTVGNFLFRPLPEVFIRFHGHQESFNHNEEAIERQMRAATVWMVALGAKPWTVVAQAFARRMAECPTPAVPTLHRLAMRTWCLPELVRHLQDEAATEEFFQLYRLAQKSAEGPP